MSKPLDGLREELRDNSYQLRPGERHIELPDALAIIDQFEAEHPGLVDQTLVCDTCHQPYKGPGWMRIHSTPQKVDIRIVCPACGQEVE